MRRVWVQGGCVLVVVVGMALWLPGQAPVALFGRTTAPIALLRQSWVEDLEARRLLASVGRYAPDATFSNPDGTHAEGIVAIRALFAAVYAKYEAVIQFTSRTTSESGELAYDSGGWTETLTDVGTHAATTLHGDYLTIYRRQSGNRWLIVQQVWTAAPAGDVGR